MSSDPKSKKTGVIKTVAVIVAVLAIISGGLLYFSDDKQENTGKGVIVRLNAPFPAIDFAPFYVAKSKGWITEGLEPMGASPDYVGSFGEIAIGIESLATDRIDFVLTSTVPALTGRAAGVDIKIVWLSATLYSEVVIDKDLSITSFEDLASLQIGTLAGSDSLFWLHELLGAKVGGDMSKILQVFSRPADILNAFDAKSINAIALFPPFNEQRIITGAAKPIPGPKMPIQVILVGRNQFIMAYPKITDSLIDTLERAKSWIIANQEEARVIVAKETGISKEVVDLSWSKLDWSATLDEKVFVDIQRKADFFAANKSIKRNLDVRGELIRLPAK